MGQLTWADVTEGQEISIVEEMPTQRLVIWAAAAPDFAAIHYDEQIALERRLPGVIIHGTLKGMIVGRLLAEWIGDAGRVLRWAVEYRAMDMPRQPITVWARVTRKYEDGDRALIDLDVGVRQTDGVTETTPGTATIELSRG